MTPRGYTLLVGLAASTILRAQPASPFDSGVWCGNVSPTSVNVVARLTSAGQRVRLQVSPNASLSPAIFSTVATTADTAGNTLALSVAGLKPDTDYYYGLEVAGALRIEPASRGRFRTFPFGRGSFKIAFGGDSHYGHADQRAFDAIVAERPLLFIHLGDLHYNDTNSINVDDYRANYDRVLNQPNQSALYRSIPLAYMWSDHDFCGNDSDGTAIGRDAARAVYKERVPHYPIATNAGGTMAQAFTIGRVRVIMTDTRSAAHSPNVKESATKTRLGAGQKAWFKQELISARDSGAPLILWANPDPWIGAAALGSDMWAGYATERTELANFIRDNRIANVVSISTDMHALAYDDGANSDYATGGGAPITVLHASALTADGSIKGGPYSGGALAGSQQYGILEIYDTGGPSVACRFLGMRVGEGPKLTYIFSSSAVGAADRALINISTLARVASATDSIVSGFVISGSTSRSMLVRAIGPTLAAFGVADPLGGARLSLYQGDRLIATNGGWAGTAEGAAPLSAAFDRAGAFRLLDENSGDAALVMTLAPGAYTVQVTSADGRPGTALLEVYEVQ
ncbi:MAG: hypothetical protein EXS32_15780 [Opitutus sp.]|nr:hypothetical protein [Opitutus sp.]